MRRGLTQARLLEGLVKGRGQWRRSLMHERRELADESFNISAHFLDRIVDLGYGDRHAIIESVGKSGSTVTTYSQLLSEVKACASALRGLGLREEERVALIMHDRKEFIISFLATARIGCVALLLNPLSPTHLISNTIKRTLCRAMITERHLAAPLLADSSVLSISVCGDRACEAAEPVGGSFVWDVIMTNGKVALEKNLSDGMPSETIADSPCYWLTTSGTTGIPKVVMHRHIDLKIAAETYADDILRMNLKNPDVTFSAAPMFHSYGLGNSIAYPFSFGGTVILEPSKPLYPPRISHILKEFRPSVFYTVPSSFNALLEAELPKTIFSSVRIAVSAGEPLPNILFDRFRTRYGVEILDGIGSSETSSFYCSNRIGSSQKHSCGAPLRGHDIQLRDEHGSLQRKEVGCRGEMFVKSPTAATGYYCDAKKSREVFIGDYIATGDMFELMKDDHYKYLGRNSDMLKVKGEWFSPLFVENVLSTHDLVDEVAVVGHQGDGGMMEVVAFIVPHGSFIENNEFEIELTLTEFCLDKMDKFQIPTRFCFVESIEKNPNGKILRNKMRDRLGTMKAIAPKKRDAKQVKDEFLTLINQNIQGELIMDMHGKKTLLELGVDSSNLTRLKTTMEKRYCKVPYKILYKESINEILKRILEFEGSSEVIDADNLSIDWNEECRLCPQIANLLCDQDTQLPQVQERGMLLTGATGFLGMHIMLEYLFGETNTPVYVIIRAHSLTDAVTKLLSAAKRYHMEAKVKHYYEMNRIKVICGDLEEDFFGMTRNQFLRLGECVDTIVHNGAAVNWLLDYSSLKRANVNSTIDLLRLCALSDIKKRFIYVSSIGVFLSHEKNNEQITFDKSADITSMGGYGATKRVSEILVEQAVTMGLDGYICRPGTVSGSLHTGACNRQDIVNRFLLTICQLKAAPILPQGGISMLPVEHVASVVSKISKSTTISDEFRKMTLVGDAISLEEIVHGCEAAIGHKIATVSLVDFVSLVKRNYCPLYPVVNFFESENDLPLSDEALSYERKSYLNFIGKNSMQDTSCNGNGIVEKYLSYLVK